MIVEKGLRGYYSYKGSGGITAIAFQSGGVRKQLYGNSSLNDGSWHLFAGVYDGNNILIYKDGVLDTFAPNTGGVDSNSLPLSIGASTAATASLFFEGSLDDVRIYSRALSSMEVQELYTENGYPPPSGNVSINSGSSYTNSIFVTSTLSATDTEGVSQMQFSNDNSTWSEPEVYATTKAWTLSSGEGAKIVYVKFQDSAGNWSGAYSGTIVLDTTAPTTTDTPSGYTFGNWTNSGSVSITLSATDGSGSGVASGYPKYCIDTANTCMPSTTYSTAFNVTCSSGSTCTQYVRYRSVDNANNTESTKSSMVKQDLQAPETSASIPGDTYSSAQGVLLNCSDPGGSGCASTKYCLGSGCTDWTTYSGETIPISNSTALRFYSTDNVGNTEAVKTETYIFTHTLTVNTTGNGSGIVSGGGLYPYGTTHDISATADSGSTFTGWSGDCSDSVSPLGVTMLDRDMTCTASFTLNQHTLTVNVDPASTGSGTIGGSGVFDYGTIHQVTASAITGSSFTGWSGDCSGTTSPVDVTILDRDMTCSATFTLNSYTITTTSGANGSVVCTPNPVNYGLSSTCSIIPDTGYHIESVTVNGALQTPALSSYTFDNVTSPHNIAATFSIDTFIVSFSFTGSGAMTCTPATVPLGGSFACSLYPDGGYYLVSLLDNTVEVKSLVSNNLYSVENVTVDHTMTAAFHQNPKVLRVWGVGPTYSSSGYLSILEAYGDAFKDEDILIQNLQFYGDLDFYNDISIWLTGGYDTDFENVTGFTTIHGKMTISKGTVTVENLILQ